VRKASDTPVWLMQEHAAEASLPRPDTLRAVGRYRLEALIGEGDMARVYRALDESTGRTIAFKRLERKEANIAALFEREYHCLASIRHSLHLDRS
jgi:serine/threonine protein kinase